jgi:hypothetical protein
MSDQAATPHGHLVLVHAADIPDQPPCCQRAHERGYRRGYRDGYTYAMWDLADVLRWGQSLIDQVERFRVEHLTHWVWRAYHNLEAVVRKENGPRCRFQRPSQKEKGGAPDA